MPWHIPESLLRKTEGLRRKKRRKGRKVGLPAEQLQAGDGAGASGEGGGGEQQSWRGVARSRHPSASGPHPPGGREREDGEKEQRGTERVP